MQFDRIFYRRLRLEDGCSVNDDVDPDICLETAREMKQEKLTELLGLWTLSIIRNSKYCLFLSSGEEEGDTHSVGSLRKSSPQSLDAEIS
jgi:hypothetical protein